MLNPGFLNWFKTGLVELGICSLCKSNYPICCYLSSCWEDYECLHTLCRHQIQVLPDMHYKNKTVNQRPALGLLVAFTLRCRFHFKPKGTLKATKRKKKWGKKANFNVNYSVCLGLNLTYLQIYFSRIFPMIFFISNSFSINYFGDIFFSRDTGSLDVP